MRTCKALQRVAVIFVGEASNHNGRVWRVFLLYVSRCVHSSPADLGMRSSDWTAAAGRRILRVGLNPRLAKSLHGLTWSCFWAQGNQSSAVDTAISQWKPYSRPERKKERDRVSLLYSQDEPKSIALVPLSTVRAQRPRYRRSA